MVFAANIFKYHLDQYAYKIGERVNYSLNLIAFSKITSSYAEGDFFFQHNLKSVTFFEKNLYGFNKNNILISPLSSKIY